jgi:uncharacterized protein (TIGR03435 family)
MKILRFLCTVITLSAVMLSGALFSQTVTKPAFEVASIKPAPPMAEVIQEIVSGKRSVNTLQPNIDNVRADFGYLPLNNMIMYAYKLKQYQLSAPDWLMASAFEIHAKLPEGGTKEQVPEMMQSLLAERFKLVSHQESKEQPIYALLISKDGLKLKEAVADPAPVVPAADAANAPAEKDNPDKNTIVSLKGSDGQQVKIKQQGNGMEISGGSTGKMTMNMTPNGTMSLDIAKMTMTEFCELLNQLVDRPVMDMTDLKGSYQISLEIPLAELLTIAKRIAPKMGLPLPPDLGNSGIAGAAPGGGGGLNASEPSGGSIFQALQKLGLKLDARKMPIETLIVDKIEKTPTED